MTQYQNDPAKTSAPAVNSSASHDRELQSLRERVQQQNDDIAVLRRELRRLRNELRVAVNTFNLRNHG